MLTVIATAVAFGVLGLSLSVVAFGQSTTTQPLGDYTSTVPSTTPTEGTYTSTVPTTPATTPAPAPAPKQTQTVPSQSTTPQSAVAPSKSSGTTPNVAAAPTGTTPKALAFTGANPLPLLAVGLLLVGLGAFVQLRRRRA